MCLKRIGGLVFDFSAIFSSNTNNRLRGSLWEDLHQENKQAFLNLNFFFSLLFIAAMVTMTLISLPDHCSKIY